MMGICTMIYIYIWYMMYYDGICLWVYDGIPSLVNIQKAMENGHL